jgi:two-component system response regulator AtoC
MTARVLIVEDEPVVRYALVELLEERGFETVAFADGRAALPHLADADVVLTDLAMPELDGMGVLREARCAAPGVPVIVLTARGTEKSAVEAMKAGAHDYLTKPFEIDEVVLAVGHAAESAALRRDARRAAAERATGRTLVGDSPVMRSLLARVERIAPRDVTVHVRGETGTGKELVASLVHALSDRRSGPFVRFNAAAIPAELAEAELFGHTRGAFTGAHEARPGYFARADGGTLVLDEIGDLSPGIQAALLRAVENREIQPVGAAQPRRVDVRLVTCTHRDLRADVAAGRFREDLYYRLAVVELEVPPLRARTGDIAALARAFAARFAERFGLEDVRLSDALVEQLRARPWPGNVRELENAIARLVAESDGGVLDAMPDATPAVAAPATPAPDGELPFRVQVAAFERDLITRAMTAAGGNRAEAARRLGLSRVTLLDRMKRLGL